MAHGDFVWCDLSTRQIKIARTFYSQLFGWTYERENAPDGSDYDLAFRSNPIAGLFPMPKTFDEMGMPCFWMSYMEVSSLPSAVGLAEDLGGKVEVGPVDGVGGTRIALVRDPLGAGFTLVEGRGLTARTEKPRHGEMAWNELYVSNANAVIPFCSALFNWEIERSDVDENQYDVKINGGIRSAICEIPDRVRGKAQFWGVHFAVDDIKLAQTCVRDKGQLVYEKDNVILAKDPDGAAFFLTPTPA